MSRIQKAKQLSVVTYEMDLRGDERARERGRAVTLPGTPSSQGQQEHDTLSRAYQRFLFIGIKPSFADIFVKAIEISPYEEKDVKNLCYSLETQCA